MASKKSLPKKTDMQSLLETRTKFFMSHEHMFHVGGNEKQVIQKIKELYNSRFGESSHENIVFDGIVKDYLDSKTAKPVEVTTSSDSTIVVVPPVIEPKPLYQTPKHGFDGGEDYSNVWTARYIFGVLGLAIGLVVAFFGTVIWYTFG